MTAAHRLLAGAGMCLLMLAGVRTAAAQGQVDAALIKRGEYLATAGDCVACHTAPGGKPMAGGLPLPTPVGDIISTNITPSASHGIGNYTLQQFTDALRRGVRADGQRLYPAMPYTAYAKVTDEDARALYAYFMGAVAPVDEAPPPTRLPFPVNIRLSMAAWNLLFLDDRRFTPDPARSAEWNRGAYLVNGLAHCSTCHTPRNLLMAEVKSLDLGGGSVGPWQAPNITSDANSGIGGWSVPELVSYLRDGHAANKGQAGGPMAEAIDNSLRHLSEDDLRAIAGYLKVVPAVHEAADTRPVFAWGEAADDLNSIRGVALPQDPNQMTGPQLYDAHCATCHQASGQGSFDGGLPPLFHNTALGRHDANNLVMVMLAGLHRRPDVFMPAFARDLSDQQLATLASYLTRRYGNPQASVTAGQVRTLRAGGGAGSLLPGIWVGLAAVSFLILVALFWFLRRRSK